MKKTLLKSLLIFGVIIANAQSIDISKDWNFQFGDSIIWSKSDYKGTNWKVMQELGSVESLGFPDFAGYAWFRKKIVIPSSYIAPASKFGYINVVLGGIDDNDQTYFNGKKNRESGTMPPNYVQGFYEFRVYKVMFEDVLWDKENLIAVRLYDHLGDGGFYTGPYLISFPSNESIELSKSIPGYNLTSDQVPYSNKLKIEDSLKTNALKYNGIRFESSMPGEISLFCNNTFVGTSNKSENHRFLIPLQLLQWNKENEITYYLSTKESKNKIIYSKNVFKSATNTDMLTVSMSESSDSKFKKGMNNTLSVEVQNNSNSDFNGKLKIISISDIGTNQSELNLEIELPKQSKISKNMLVNLPFKGIYKINYYLIDNNSNLAITGTLKKGFWINLFFKNIELKILSFNLVVSNLTTQFYE